MKTSSMALALVGLLAAAARAQEEPKKPSMVCKDGVCTEPAAPPEKGKDALPPSERAPIAYEPATGLVYRSATDTVILYGLLDITLSSIDNVNARRDRKVGYQTSWFSGDRWGITGKHVLFNTDKFGVIFRLESEYVLNTGEMDTPNVLFNRDAWIGFEGDQFGKLTFGRQNTLARDFAQNYGDPYGTPNVRFDEGGWTNTNNFKQLIFYAGSVTGTRMDNGVVWKKAVGPIMLGLGYQFGEVPGAFNRNTTASAGLAYNGGLFDVSGYYTHANVNDQSNNSWSIGGNILPLPAVRFNAGFFWYQADQAALGQRTDHAFTVSTRLSPLDKVSVEAGWEVLNVINAAQNAGGNTLNPFNNATATGVATTGTGNKKTFYASIFYHFDRRAEVYLAGDYMWLSGGYKVAVNNGFDNQTELATGIRFRF